MAHSHEHTRKEVYDVNVMAHLLRHDGVSKQDKKQLRDYKRMARDGNNVIVEYIFGKGWADIRRGDLYAKHSLGLASFPREIRGALAQKYYWDVDMANAHPVILSGMCKRDGLVCPKIDEFILNRKIILNELMEQNGRDRA